MATTTTTLVRRARLLAYLTIGWNVIEGVVALGAGAAAQSVALVGFGLDSFIEVFAALVVLWHLQGIDEHREQRALRLIAYSFFALAAYLAIRSAFALIGGVEAAESIVGIAITALSLLVMPALAFAKRRVGRELGNQSVVADSAQTMLCSLLSVVVLMGLLLDATFGWSWADPTAALIVAALAIREGREAWAGDTCC